MRVGMLLEKRCGCRAKDCQFCVANREAVQNSVGEWEKRRERTNLETWQTQCANGLKPLNSGILSR